MLRWIAGKLACRVSDRRDEVMDANFAIKPVSKVSAAGSERANAMPVRDAVATDLGGAKAVAAAARVEAAAPATTRTHPFAPDFIADPQSREVMFRALALSKGRPTRAEREQALRRRHAYDRSLERDEDGRAECERTDFRT